MIILAIQPWKEIIEKIIHGEKVLDALYYQQKKYII